MRKILSFVAAMLFAFAANATTWNITPTHCHEGDRDDCTLYVTLDRGAQAGDTIVLADGTYHETLTTTISNPVVIMAAEGAHPVVEMSGYFKVYASAEFEGLKFKFVGDSGNGYCMYFYDNTSKYLKLEGCEFQDYTQYCVSSWEDYHIDSCIVNNCYFHDLAKAPFYFAASSLENNVNACDKLKVTNSTFANIAVVGYVAVLDIRNNSGNVTGATSKLEVDHCTFYNCQGDYERMIQSYKSPDATISNCIMMNPIVEGKTEIYATYLYGGSIHHNLNYQTKRQYGSGVTVTDSIQRDPLFVDAANLDLHLGDGSPALGAGSDGSNLGDPRWWPVVGAPVYYLVGTMNNWTPADEYKFAENTANEGEYMLTAALTVGDSLKVLEIVGNTQNWYPDNAPNYAVDANHAGTAKEIYFRPDGQGGDDWYYHVLYIAENPAPLPILGTHFVKVTEAPADWAGEYLIVNGDSVAFNSALETLDAINNGVDVNVADNMIPVSESLLAARFTIAAMEGGYSLKATNGKYIGATSYSNSLQASDEPIANVLSLDANNNAVIAVNVMNSGNPAQVTMRYNKASNQLRFRYYKNGQEPVALYKLTVVEPAPVVNYSLKNNWGAVEEWTWKEMTKDGDNYKLENVVFGGTGVNYKSDLLGAPELWVPMADFLGDAIDAKDTVTFVLNPADSTITATLLGKYVEPAGCDWNNIEFLGSTDAQYANQFKVCVASELDPQVVNIQQGFGDEIGIYCQGFANADFQSISVPEGKYSVQGAGIIFHISYFTAKETEVEVICGGGGHFVYQFTVLNVNGEEPAINYSLKNNWGAVEEWTWKEMTKDGDNYKLENVVFGGTGVNYKSDLLGAPEMWVPMANFLGDAIDAKDTVTFVLNPADSTITATLLGKYVEPVPEPVFELWKVVATTDTAAGAIYVDNEYVKVQTVYQGKVSAQNAIMFDEAYTHIMQVRVEDFPTAEVPTGTKRADCTPLVFTAKQDAVIKLFYLRQAIDKMWTENDNKDLVLFDQAAPTTKVIAASMVEDSVLADSSYYFIGKAYALEAGHVYTLAAKGTTIKLFGIAYQTDPEPEHTYTVAGAPATLFGQEWAPSYAANDMENLVGSEYLYIWAKDSVILPAGKIEFKVCQDHAWNPAWPAQNYVLTLAESGIYNIAIYFNPLAEADSLRILATADKVGDAVVLPTVKLHGDFTGSWVDSEAFALAQDSLSASLNLALAAGTYKFGMKFDGSWKANGANLTRENPSTSLASGSGDMQIVADQAGEYTFTYFYDADSLVVTYPAIPQHYDVAEAIAAQLEDSVQIYVRGIVTKISFKGKNFDKYGSANIFVADATGAEGEFEFFNCYSLNADTFRTSSPDYDAASTSWAEFNSIADENGVEVALGDTIEAFGKFKLYGNTYELLTGCYITVLKKYVEPIGAPEYFLVGTMNEWEPADGFKFEPNPGAEGEYMLTATLGVGDSLKVLEIVGNTRTYYPDLAPNYGVDSLHAGESKKIYFRPDGQGGEGWYFGYFFVEENQEPADTIPTTAPAAPTAAEDDVMAIYCNHYTNNNLNFVIAGYGGAFEDLMIENTRVGYKRNMTWDCVIDPINTDSIHDLSGYKKLHADFWAPEAAKVKFTAEAVAGGNYKDGVVVDLNAGWNCLDFVVAEWPGEYNFSNLKCFVLEQYKTPEGESFEGNPFAFANIYFYEKEAQGFENIDASVKAVKVLQNGQIFILRGDKVYTVTGQPIAK